MNDQSKTKQGLIQERTSLNEAGEYARSIINTVREPLIVLDHDLRVVTASRSFYEFFKVKPDETEGQLIYNLGNEQWDIPKLRELLETILPQKTTFDNYEVEHDFATIGKRVMLLNARQIKRALGKERIILLAIEDITERKQLENLLTDSEERYRHLFETASDGIIFLEQREGKITHANPASEKMLGYTKKELIGNKLQDIGVSLDMGDFQKTIQHLNRNGFINYTDVPVRTKSGQQMDTDIYLVDRATLVQCSIRDVSERKRKEEELRKSEEKYRTILEDIQEGYFEVDFAGNFTFFNDALCRALGYSKEELMGMNNRQYTDKENSEKLFQTFNKVYNTGEPTDGLDCQIIRKDGTKRYVEASVSLQKDSSDKPKGFRGIVRDVTERKRAEVKLQQTLDSLNNAVAATIQVMVSAVEMRDPYTAGHQLRSANLACAIAEEMGLPKEKIDGIHMAGSIHDIGKLSIPAEILSKPTKLTEIEFSLIKEHSLSGYEMLKNVESPWPLAQIVYQHHERMDGSGYPRNLKGDEIIMEARIMAVSGVVEAMASHRPYRPGLGMDAALVEIEKNRGILYDATVADACLRLFREKGYQLT
ncbi:MAG: PAS domain S-box protein [Smithella sp.]